MILRRAELLQYTASNSAIFFQRENTGYRIISTLFTVGVDSGATPVLVTFIVRDGVGNSILELGNFNLQPGATVTVVAAENLQDGINTIGSHHLLRLPPDLWIQPQWDCLISLDNWDPTNTIGIITAVIDRPYKKETIQLPGSGQND